MGIKIKLMIYIALASAVGAIFWYQNYQIDKMQANMQILAANNAKLTVAINLQKKAVGSLEVGLSNTIANNNHLAQQLTIVDEQRQTIIQELNSYRGRLGNAALKKPTLIERRATNATTNILLQFATETGSKDK